MLDKEKVQRLLALSHKVKALVPDLKEAEGILTKEEYEKQAETGGIDVKVSGLDVYVARDLLLACIDQNVYPKYETRIEAAIDVLEWVLQINQNKDEQYLFESLIASLVKDATKALESTLAEHILKALKAQVQGN